MTTPNPFIAKVTDELSGVQKKLELLKNFIDTERFFALPWPEQDLLKQQAHVMFNYQAILCARLYLMCSRDEG